MRGEENTTAHVPNREADCFALRAHGRWRRCIEVIRFRITEAGRLALLHLHGP
jgi:hypothetical protein